METDFPARPAAKDSPLLESRPRARTIGEAATSTELIYENRLVGLGEYYLVTSPAKLTCIGLGSCVGIAIYDIHLGIGGMAHAMLPRYEEGRDKKTVTKYADSAIYVMVDDLLALGSNRSSLRAKLAGGAQMFSFLSSDTLNIGLRNAESAKETLKKEHIAIVGEHLGGTKGRTCVFDPESGAYSVQIANETFMI